MPLWRGFSSLLFQKINGKIKPNILYVEEELEDAVKEIAHF